MAIIGSFLFFLGGVFLSSFSHTLLLSKKGELQQFGRHNKFFAFSEKHFLTIHIFEQTLFQLRLVKTVLTFSAFLFLLAQPFLSIVSIFVVFLFLTYLSYLATNFMSKKLFALTTPTALFIFYLFYPLTSPFLALYRRINYRIQKKSKNQFKSKLQHLIMGDYDEKLFASLATFNEKDVREVMIPRIKIFALQLNTSIGKAAKAILHEGYSRIPVYGTDLDNIVGFLLYKDLLKVFIQAQESPSLLNETIEMLLKPVIYVPENKKISALFQDLRKKQSHLAIIVNEYGSTEGVITIEDILEELVGEIKDEYDIEEEEGFWKLPGGSWVVDAKVSIIDIEKKIGIRIPHSPEYETIGGFLFHKAGNIPQKGWSLCLDEFEIEVLISSERCLEKLRLIPLLEKKEKIAKE